MEDAVKKFRAELESRGLIRKIQTIAFLCPPPDDLTPEEGVALKKSAVKSALMVYAAKHDDFGEAMLDAGIDLLLDAVVTDELVSPDPETFTPTSAEKEKVEQAKLISSLISGKANDFLKNT